MPSNRQTATNKLILDAAINKESPFDAFKRLLKTPGNRKMNYVVFEWKYFQYYHGNRDLSIERSPQNSSPITFSDLPLHILHIIVKPLALSEWLILRKVTPGLRNLMQHTDIHCKEIEFCAGTHTEESEEFYGDVGTFAKFAFEDFKIKYEETRKGSCVESWHFGKLKKYRTSENVRQTVLTDASTFLANPRLKIDRLKIDVTEYTDSENSEFLKSLNAQLDVRSIDFHANEKEIRAILELVKPGCLEEIKIGYRSLSAREFDEIAEMEQWKRARTVECYSCPGFQTEKFLHFEKIKVSNFQFTDANLSKLRDLLLKSDRLELCILDCWIWNDDRSNETLDRFLKNDDDFDAKNCRYPIPNSRHHFQLEYRRNDRRGYFYGLTVTRVLNN